MPQRIIDITISPDGSMRVDNSQNDNEPKILEELASLSQLLNGSSTGYKIEQHVHSEGHNHVHKNGEVHTHG